MSFGWSAGDIYSLVVLSYKVVENYREGLISATAQVKNLHKDVTQFNAILSHLYMLVNHSHDIAFIDFKDIKGTIEDCNAYLSKYKYLQQTSSTADNGSGSGNTIGNNDTLHKLKRVPSFPKLRPRETGLKVGQAVKYNTLGGDTELKILQEKLSTHRQTLLLYLQILDRKLRTEEDARLHEHLSTVEALVENSLRRFSTVPPELPPSPTIPQQLQNSDGYQDYEAIDQALTVQKRLALLETKKPHNDAEMKTWNDILSQLEFLQNRVLNAAKRIANSTAQRGTASTSDQISLNRMLTPHHIVGTPPTRPINRVDTDSTYDSGFFELPPVREESSGVNEEFVRKGSLPQEPAAPLMVPLTPRALLKPRTLSVNAIERPALERPFLCPSSSSESVATVSPTAPHVNYHYHSRTTSVSSSEVSFQPSALDWKVIQFYGWVKCVTVNSYKPILCSITAGCDSNGQACALHIRVQNTNNPLLIIKLSHRKRPIPHIEPSGERDSADDGILAYFIDKLDTEPKVDRVQFYFQDEKSLNIFESVVYGQELLFATVVEKISTSGEGLSDRQRIRVWKKGDSKSVVFYASKREKSKRRYLTVQASDVLKKPTVRKNGLEFKLQSKNSPHLQDLKLVFDGQSDRDMFLTHFLSK